MRAVTINCEFSLPRLIGGTVAGLIAGMPVPRHPVRRICTPKYVHREIKLKLYSFRNLYPFRKCIRSQKYIPLQEINPKICLPPGN